MARQIRRNLSLTAEQALSMYYQLGLFQTLVIDRSSSLYVDSVKTRERILTLYPEIKQHVEK